MRPPDKGNGARKRGGGRAEVLMKSQNHSGTQDRQPRLVRTRVISKMMRKMISDALFFYEL